VPVNVALRSDQAFGEEDIEIEYDCPECGAGHYIPIAAEPAEPEPPN
jgi:hypothetical protein